MDEDYIASGHQPTPTVKTDMFLDLKKVHLKQYDDKS